MSHWGSPKRLQQAGTAAQGHNMAVLHLYRWVPRMGEKVTMTTSNALAMLDVVSKSVQTEMGVRDVRVVVDLKALERRQAYKHACHNIHHTTTNTINEQWNVKDSD